MNFFKYSENLATVAPSIILWSALIHKLTDLWNITASSLFSTRWYACESSNSDPLGTTVIESKNLLIPIMQTWGGRTTGLNTFPPIFPFYLFN